MKRTIIDASQMELNDKVVAIKRVSKTVKGGRTMRFSALVVVGDGNGHVGAGLGKAGEVPEAIRKGKEAAIKNLVEIPVDENKSIPHDFIGKFGSAAVLLKRAPEGTGVIAGGPARSVLEMAGGNGNFVGLEADQGSVDVKKQSFYHKGFFYLVREIT